MKSDAELDTILDRLPRHVLESALRRRRDSLEQLTTGQARVYRAVVDAIVESSGIAEDRLLSNERAGGVAQQRWQLYAELFRRGWSPGLIARATRHDRTRIYHGLRMLGLWGDQS